MQTIQQYATILSVVGLLMTGSASAFALPDTQYHFLPTETLVSNVKAQLQAQGIDLLPIHIEADAEGVVTLSGTVDSKRQAEVVSSTVMKTVGVYAVLSSLRYQDGVPITRDATSNGEVLTTNRPSFKATPSEIDEPRAW